METTTRGKCAACGAPYEIHYDSEGRGLGPQTRYHYSCRCSDAARNEARIAEKARIARIERGGWPLIVAVDFDGTLVDHRFPDIGADVPGAFEACRAFVEAGVRLILWTMRGGEHLEAAIAHCRARGLEFWFVNGNPQQRTWTDSPKAYADAYVDDAAIGCPKRENPRMGGLPYVDWSVVAPDVLERARARANRDA